MSHHPEASHHGEGAVRARPTAARHVRDGAAALESLDQYLGDISAYPLITRDEEVRLAQRIRERDQDALDKLVRSNLRFVVSVAKSYQHRGVSLGDLISEGNLGLVRAAHKFDGTRGIRFVSYAICWIRQAIMQAVADQRGIVRVPVSRAGTLSRISRRANRLLQELQREPTHEEIAERVGITAEDVATAMSISRTSVSLDAPMTLGKSNHLLEYLADDRITAPDDRLWDGALTDAVRVSLGTLRPRESVILRLYFGLDVDEVVTLEQIGAQLGITRERVRQIKEQALRRLRHATSTTSLATFAGLDKTLDVLAPVAAPDRLRHPCLPSPIPVSRWGASLARSTGASARAPAPDRA